MRRIAITGGIGSGKSFVCRMLAEHGIEIYDCDAAAKRLMRTSSELRARLTGLVGSNLYDGERLNKPVMAQFLLSSDENQRAVNAIVHPAVGEDFLRSGMKWMECAILFESGFDKLVDYKICVVAPLEIRLQRIMQRDGLTRQKAMEWISKQMPQEEVSSKCDFVIVNDGVADLQQQIENLNNIIKI
jgi:dephospho-CoA kinase